MYRQLIICMVIASLVGCASMGGSDRHRDGNQVISEAYPSATFAISNAYQFYADNTDTETAGSKSYTARPSRFDNESFIFVRPTGKEVQKFVVIQFHTLSKPRWTWTRNPEWEGQGVVRGSIETSIGDMESFSTFARMTDAIEYYGIGISDFYYKSCAAVTTMRQIPSGMARYKYLVHYIEPIDCDLIDRFAYTSGRLKRAGEARLEKHLQGALTDIHIFADK